MRQLSTFLIFALVIIVNQGSGVTAQDETKVDQVAEEAKNNAVTIIDSPKYVTNPVPPPTKPDVQTHKPEQRPPSKPPLFPDKPKPKHIFADLPRPYFGQFPKYPPPRAYPPMSMKLHSTNSIYQFPRVVPLAPHHNNFFVKSRPLPFGSTYQQTYQEAAKPPKFSLPVQTINGIRTDTVRPPTAKVPQTVPLKVLNTTTSTTTTTTEKTTTAKILRTKRIWPKRLQKSNSTSANTTENWDSNKDISSANEIDHETSASHRVRTFTSRNSTSTTTQTPAKRSYRPVTRAPKVKSTTTPLPALNFTNIGPNDWVPIVPSHYPKKIRVKRNIPPTSKRSDVFTDEPDLTTDKEMLYMQSFGLIPVPTAATMDRKNAVYFKGKRHSSPYHYGYHTNHSPYTYADHHAEESHSKPRYVTRIKHHHHHHHHKYIKTVEKPVKVPYKVEVPKPYPVKVEKKVAVPVEKIKIVDRPVPYPVTVEKKVPYPVGIKVPHPVPVKVVEKEYVPKPYPIVHHVPVVKHVQVKVPQPVPYPVEKRVPYPVEVKVPVPVDRPVPVAVPVEKQVPYPVKVLVPQPYPVETKVPYPVHVKEPVEVIKHVRVPVPQPYPVKVTVEKRVPYPVEVEKKVPVPVEVLVPQRVEVEKRVPVYIPRPYPVEKRVPYPVKVPYPVRVPVRVPYEVPVYIHHPYQMYDYEDISVSESPVTSTAHHTVTVHGNTGFTSGFQSRSDDEAPTTTTSKPS